MDLRFQIFNLPDPAHLGMVSITSACPILLNFMDTSPDQNLFFNIHIFSIIPSNDLQFSIKICSCKSMCLSNPRLIKTIDSIRTTDYVTKSADSKP